MTCPLNGWRASSHPGAGRGLGFLLLAPACACLLLACCGLIGLHQPDCAAPAVAPPGAALPPIPAAIRYLRETQYAEDRTAVPRVRYAGDWPQCFNVRGTRTLVREVSPFMAAFIHHALSFIDESSAGDLGLDRAALDDVRAMRVAAVAFMLRFRSGPERPDAGAFGFWPRREPRRLPGDWVLGRIVRVLLRGPMLAGYRAPVNLSFYPAEFAVVADADDTAAIYAALLDHERLDGGPPVTEPVERLFSDWRDLGGARVRNRGDWLPPDSGAFLTWLDYGGGNGAPLPNDVDAVVNANILYLLGRLGRLDTPGAAEAAAVINAAVLSGVHIASPDLVSPYYPDNLALHYCLSRARGRGGVTSLQEATDRLVSELLETVIWTRGGRCLWSRGRPQLNTAFAVLTLINAGYEGPEIEGAVRFLRSEQDPVTGGWKAGAFFRGRGDSGVETNWISPALTTAMALEALVRANSPLRTEAPAAR